MSICIDCKNTLKPGALFCGKCGRKVSGSQSAQASSAAVAQGKTCNHCQAVLKADAMFCNKCGAKVEPVQLDYSKCRECDSVFRPNAQFCHVCGAPRTKPALVTCEKCKQEVEATRKFCNKCGHKIGEPYISATKAVEPQTVTAVASQKRANISAPVTPKPVTPKPPTPKTKCKLCHAELDIDSKSCDSCRSLVLEHLAAIDTSISSFSTIISHSDYSCDEVGKELKTYSADLKELKEKLDALRKLEIVGFSLNNRKQEFSTIKGLVARLGSQQGGQALQLSYSEQISHLSKLEQRALKLLESLMSYVEKLENSAYASAGDGLVTLRDLGTEFKTKCNFEPLIAERKAGLKQVAKVKAFIEHFPKRYLDDASSSSCSYCGAVLSSHAKVCSICAWPCTGRSLQASQKLLSKAEAGLKGLAEYIDALKAAKGTYTKLEAQWAEQNKIFTAIDEQVSICREWLSALKTMQDEIKQAKRKVGQLSPYTGPTALCPDCRQQRASDVLFCPVCGKAQIEDPLKANGVFSRNIMTEADLLRFGHRLQAPMLVWRERVILVEDPRTVHILDPKTKNLFSASIANTDPGATKAFSALVLNGILVIPTENSFSLFDLASYYLCRRSVKNQSDSVLALDQGERIIGMAAGDGVQWLAAPVKRNNGSIYIAVYRLNQSRRFERYASCPISAQGNGSLLFVWCFSHLLLAGFAEEALHCFSLSSLTKGSPLRELAPFMAGNKLSYCQDTTCYSRANADGQLKYGVVVSVSSGSNTKIVGLQVSANGRLSEEGLFTGSGLIQPWSLHLASSSSQSAQMNRIDSASIFTDCKICAVVQGGLNSTLSDNSTAIGCKVLSNNYSRMFNLNSGGLLFEPPMENGGCNVSAFSSDGSTIRLLGRCKDQLGHPIMPASNTNCVFAGGKLWLMNRALDLCGYELS